MEGFTVTREPEFSPFDKALLLGHQELVSDMGPHGVPMSEAIDPKNQFAFIPYEAPTVDWAAKALGDKQDAFYANRPKDEKHHGHIWRLKPRV